MKRKIKCLECGGIGYVKPCPACNGERYVEYVNKPKIVCLCGSTRFKEAFEKAERDIALRGEICLTVGLFGHVEGLDMKGIDKANLDVLHLRKIDLCDEVMVLNVGGYIGKSTANEVAYATGSGKKIVYLEPRPFARDIKEEEKK